MKAAKRKVRDSARASTLNSMIATRNPKPKTGVRVPLQRCVYCGAWAAGPVCRAHTDLLFLDRREVPE